MNRPANPLNPHTSLSPGPKPKHIPHLPLPQSLFNIQTPERITRKPIDSPKYITSQIHINVRIKSLTLHTPHNHTSTPLPRNHIRVFTPLKHNTLREIGFHEHRLPSYRPHGFIMREFPCTNTTRINHDLRAYYTLRMLQTLHLPPHESHARPLQPLS
ncbi:hypothetical protein M7I_0813 [Glarea lozoyensis 74030]|uniref:Uncharacterized protein n=1 Tax=Glarea lozoyensis (strain ATCC 74030 / MF5533) TaxID=1104152 RepID=H0EED8_GLAL7|nr:hypothetical protein M7I_0813 [Glarea lozoyensis 74030]